MSNRHKRKYKLTQKQRRACYRKLKAMGVTHINGRNLGSCKNKELFDMVIEKTGYSIHHFLIQKETQGSTKEGKIYIIGNLSHGLVKIGFSTNPYKRLTSIQTGCPFKIDIIATAPGTPKVEKLLHKKYKSLNTNGEWFLYKDALKEKIDSVISRKLINAYNGKQDEIE